MKKMTKKQVIELVDNIVQSINSDYMSQIDEAFDDITESTFIEIQDLLIDLPTAWYPILIKTIITEAIKKKIFNKDDPVPYIKLIKEENIKLDSKL